MQRIWKIAIQALSVQLDHPVSITIRMDGLDWVRKCNICTICPLTLQILQNLHANLCTSPRRVQKFFGPIFALRPQPLIGSQRSPELALELYGCIVRAESRLRKTSSRGLLKCLIMIRPGITKWNLKCSSELKTPKVCHITEVLILPH